MTLESSAGAVPHHMLHVVHVLGELRRSGAEMMLANSIPFSGHTLSRTQSLPPAQMKDCWPPNFASLESPFITCPLLVDSDSSACFVVKQNLPMWCMCTPSEPPSGCVPCYAFVAAPSFGPFTAASRSRDDFAGYADYNGES